jgi:hypothetical protein
VQARAKVLAKGTVRVSAKEQAKAKAKVKVKVKVKVKAKAKAKVLEQAKASASRVLERRQSASHRLRPRTRRAASRSTHRTLAGRAFLPQGRQVDWLGGRRFSSLESCWVVKFRANWNRLATAAHRDEAPAQVRMLVLRGRATSKGLATQPTPAFQRGPCVQLLYNTPRPVPLT